MKFRSRITFFAGSPKMPTLSRWTDRPTVHASDRTDCVCIACIAIFYVMPYNSLVSFSFVEQRNLGFFLMSFFLVPLLLHCLLSSGVFFSFVCRLFSHTQLYIHYTNEHRANIAWICVNFFFRRFCVYLLIMSDVHYSVFITDSASEFSFYNMLISMNGSVKWLCRVNRHIYFIYKMQFFSSSPSSSSANYLVSVVPPSCISSHSN